VLTDLGGVVRPPRRLWRGRLPSAPGALAGRGGGAPGGDRSPPVALKVESPDILHKSEAGALRLGVADAAQARRAFDEVVGAARRHAPQARIDGVLVQEMVQGGTEMVVGLHQDPQFGPVVMVGLGGVFIEVLEDVVFGLAPLCREDALEMVRGLRGARILDGVRGRPRADLDALLDVLVAVSRLGADAGGAIRELDINPLIVLEPGRGALAVDTLVVLDTDGQP